MFLAETHGENLNLWLNIAVGVVTLVGVVVTVAVAFSRVSTRASKVEETQTDHRASIDKHSGEITRLTADLANVRQSIAVAETKNGHIERQIDQLSERVEAMPQRIAELLAPMLRDPHGKGNG